MTDDLDRLDKLAEAATPGPWEERKDDADVMHVVHDQERISYVARIGGAEEAYAIHDAEFIAAANPKVVRALVQRVRDADERVSELEKMLSNYTREYRRECNKRLRAGAERDAALAAIERVRVAHRRYTYYELEDSCPDMTDEHREEHHHESYEIGEFYCDQMPTGDVVCDLCRDADGERMDWPCPTIAALDTLAPVESEGE